jgi:hypothetical protein
MSEAFDQLNLLLGQQFSVDFIQSQSPSDGPGNAFAIACEEHDLRDAGVP